MTAEHRVYDPILFAGIIGRRKVRTEAIVFYDTGRFDPLAFFAAEVTAWINDGEI